MIGIKDVAKAAGVSTATVSLALNNSPLVNEHTRERVQQAARELGYRPNPYARSLVTRRSRMIGLIVPDIRNVYYAALVHHVNHAVRAADYGMVIAMSENNPAYERRIVEEMRGNRVDGLLFSPLNSVAHDTGYLADFPLPLLMVASRYDVWQYPAVLTDYENGMASITRRALAKGRRSLCFVTGPAGEHSLDARLRGYLSAYPSPASVLHCPEVSYAAGVQAAKELLAAGGQRGQKATVAYDCILCVNDTMAAGVENELLRHGVSVPNAVGLGGYDDVLFAETTAVPITTVRQNIQEMAETSVRLLLAAMAGEEIPACTTIPAELVERGSL